MALLSQLMIRGIRSVGPEDEDVHLIRFLSPLTIISGPNGTGKTTIIEALNFATTGDTPSGKYQAFIHSIDIARRSRVDGMVKLEFFDAKKQKVVITKRLNAARDAKIKAGMKCNADESNIQITRLDGSVVTNSNKVMDTKQEALNLLGVPQAILSNVIFCHQEDSCWPLSEPKELKTRFDKIFQLTRFVKAVDQMKKLKKEYENDLKRIVAELGTAEINIKNKAKYMKDRDSSEISKKKASDLDTELKQSIDRLNKEIGQIRLTLQEVDKVQRTLDVKQAELYSMEKHLSNLKVTPFVGSEQDLRAEIEELRSSQEFVNIQDEKKRIDEALEAERRQLITTRDQKKRYEDKLVHYKLAETIRQQTASELNQLKVAVCQEFNFSVSVDIQSELSMLLENKRAELAALMKRENDERVENQRRLETAHHALTQSRIEAQNAETRSKKTETEIRHIEEKLRAAEGSEDRIASLNLKIGELESSLSTFPNVHDKIIENQRFCQNLRSELEGLRRAFREAEEFEEFRKDKERKINERNEVQHKLDSMLNKHKQDLEEIFDTLIEGPWSQEVTAAKTKAEERVNNVEGAVSRADLALERERQMLKQLEIDERKVISEIQTLTLKVEQSCGCSASDVVPQFTRISKQLDDARKELGPLRSKRELYESWTEEVKDSSCCPLCDRRFTGKGGASNLVEKLQNMTLSLPEEVDRLETTVVELQEKERKLADAKVYAEQIEKLKNTEREIIDKKTASQEKLKQTEAHSERCKAEQTNAKTAFQRVSRVSDDVSLMDSLLKSVSTLDKEIECLSKKLPKDTIRSSALKDNIDSKESELNTAVEQGYKLQRQESERNKIADELIKLRESKVQLGEAAAQSSHLQEQLQIKRKDLDELFKIRQECLEKIPHQEMSVQGCREIWERSESQLRQEIEKKRTEDREIENSLKKVMSLEQKLQSQQDNNSEIQMCTQKISQCEERISNSEAKCGRLAAQQGDLNGRQARLSTLESQLTRLDLEKNIEKMREEITQLCPMSMEEVAQMRTRYSELQNEKEQNENKKSHNEGRLGEINKKYKEAVAALQGKDMKQAEKTYRDWIVEKMVSEKTIEDLGKYGELLDSSILQFHADKMTAINEILDDLWRKVYKGVDIESIKIKADAAASTDKRKSYDYKLVMIVEGGVEMEMRDRCSAGQKMLASILIRIALADVFGGLCSIIALDEPTTNLDAGKVEHMAEMLNDLVAARRTDRDGVTRGRQFQMIVITHDERLVDRLTLGCRPEFHYVLGKDGRGVSYIKRQYPDGHTENTD